MTAADGCRASSRRHAARRARNAGLGRCGFTLMELLVAMILFAVISVTIWNLLLGQSRFFETEEGANSAQQNARVALQRIAEDIRLAGQGLDGLALLDAGVILPNDGTVPSNVVQTSGITLLSVPSANDPLSLSVDGVKGASALELVEDSLGVATSIAAGEEIVIHDPQLNQSQIVSVSGNTDQGATVRLDLSPADTLLAAYSAATSSVYRANSVSYRLNTSNPKRTFIERRLSSAAWQKTANDIESLTFTYFDAAGAAFSPTSSDLRLNIRRVRIQLTGRHAGSSSPGAQPVKIEMSTDVSPRNVD